jgi:hypothetical protein
MRPTLAIVSTIVFRNRSSSTELKNVRRVIFVCATAWRQPHGPGGNGGIFHHTPPTSAKYHRNRRRGFTEHQVCIVVLAALAFPWACGKTGLAIPRGCDIASPREANHFCLRRRGSAPSL